MANKGYKLVTIGIRRFFACPVYSESGGNPKQKARMERFFSATSQATVASIYAPVMYAPQHVLQFRIRVNEDDDDEETINQPYLGELVATGSLLTVDPSRPIIKRILLSGHPFKINKRSVVTRFMFFFPEDVNYFKPIKLFTKWGAIGHIRQSLGTHGYMKCQFDRTIKSSDVVLMPLYKRIFPKWTYEPCVADTLALPRDLSLPSNMLEAATRFINTNKLALRNVVDKSQLEQGLVFRPRRQDIEIGQKRMNEGCELDEDETAALFS
ncbi:unnamed protein product [Protopolystoma xenopodis]|uniref:Pre-rRNA-processing protein TSR1 homolog n=1 Tax=Protopolystoma xenopodis TaxID=117903 RepID=A0A3S5FC71_9PLAT|nr:unnamed protein product [Protopolystoma xenopodis]